MSLMIVSLGIFICCRYGQYILVWQVNPKIHANGIKLMMPASKVRNLIGEEDEYIQGFGGYILSYPSKGLRLTLLNDEDTDFYHKVSEISISSPEYTLFDITIDEDFKKVLNNIHKHGFKREKPGYPGYWKGNAYIIIDTDSDKIKGITIGMKDSVSSSRTY
ncbi:hypothetical protein [Oxobacter pfennigii]|uniref:hypothetical protein n=1 Tax=Oxobacter pfennigii TaxID=36849 RepID=UPI0013648A0A|nr:hypothetical protein [Oxobacter pfennigii]